MNPEALQRYLQTCDEKMEQYGWMLQGVFPTADDPEPVAWVYTIGMGNFGLPDLVMVGLPYEHAGHILNRICAEMRDGGKEILAGATLDGYIQNNLPLRAVAVPPPEWPEWFGMGMNYYAYHDRTPEAYLQIVWPDAAGKFPWDSGFDEQYRERQPIIGHL